ncbi:hypothetical protein SAMN04487820_103122 [Actinopolyspora mzabensis]|uniref:DUF7144 domain-containing protein n=1 Tax=Actinopolyspora mzabensis TaxID=995066 RepID=A0A1G8XXG8_ACTMZ|nr:hypothetical protein [Actinopolyspora mzabensis]SDJ95176.1 hypothetical protein SAMN04487820_103122 [Actinopolyspora mzabensis]
MAHAERETGSPGDRSHGLLASGVEMFAGVLMLIIGLFHVVVGLTALLQSSFYVVAAGYFFGADITVWGWVHVALGLLVGATGAALLSQQRWARLTGITIVAVSALGNFLFIPFQPLWSVLIIAVDVVVIWALATQVRGLPATRE